MNIFLKKNKEFAFINTRIGRLSYQTYLNVYRNLCKKVLISKILIFLVH